jgi:hypothetical protein
MMKKILVISIFIILCACNAVTDAELVQENIGEWSIPLEAVLDGGPGRDGIPALVNPELIDVSNTGSDFLKDSDLIIGFKNGDNVVAYPHTILDWHEIINDNVGDISVAVTYCPLTGTGIGWNRILNGSETTFGVSGLLYNTNLIPFDRATNSNWSQILNKSVNGSLKDQRADLIILFETNWKTWKTLYPNSKVVSQNTGFSRSYGISPYGDYSTNHNRLLFPVSSNDDRLSSKERVHSIVTDSGKAKSYRFSSLVSKNIVIDSFEGKKYLVAGNNDFMVSFLLDDSVASLQFNYVFKDTELLLKDNEGNEWNVFGEAISGPRVGQFLKPSDSFMGYWFSIPAFYTTEIYQD